MLIFVYYANTHDRGIFTPTVHSALQKIVQVLKCEQQHATCSHYSWPHPVPTHDQYNPSTGLIWSAFRPSDDPVTYRFNVPQNAFAVVAMKLVAAFAREAFKDDSSPARRGGGRHASAGRSGTLRTNLQSGLRRLDVRLRDRRLRPQ